ncbi:MAG: dTDP-4-dehydrorhamnose reductase [Bacteroidota bacterium]
MTQIIVTGSKGQVGSELQWLTTQYPHFQFTFVDQEELDITDAHAVHSFFDASAFDYCINCAAYTAVDRAESDRPMAHQVNVEGSRNLAAVCQKNDTQLIQLSTDYVYHNQQNRPFVESDETQPQSVYAITKLAGEQIAQQVAPSTMIIRTSWVYSSFGHNFVKTMLRLGQERDQLNVVFDQIGTPTYARDLAKAILDIISQVHSSPQERSKMAGIFHYSNEGVTSWYDFAIAIMRIENIDCQVFPIETTAYPTPASRPPFSLLNKAKIRQTFELKIPHWEQSLNACLKAIRATTS